MSVPPVSELVIPPTPDEDTMSLEYFNPDDDVFCLNQHLEISAAIMCQPPVSEWNQTVRKIAST